MILAKMNDKAVLIGISDGNIKHLKDNRPMLVRKESLEIDHDIIIVWGKTEKDIEKMLVDNELTSPFQ